jgi:hypothetical protein
MHCVIDDQGGSMMDAGIFVHWFRTKDRRAFLAFAGLHQKYTDCVRMVTDDFGSLQVASE